MRLEILIQHSARSLRLLLAILSVGLLLPSLAQAGFLADFTGNTQMSDAGASVSGAVDFAVYANPTGHNWATDLGVSGAGVLNSGFGGGGGVADTGAAYVYFYEVVNTQPGPGTGSISSFSVNSYSMPYSSGGYLTGYVFNNLSNLAVGPPAGPTTTPFLGPAPTGDDPVNNAPSNSGVNLVNGPAAFTNSAVAPTSPFFVSSLGGPLNLDFANFQWANVGSGVLTQNAYSPVLFLTSNTAPTYSEGTISATPGTAADGGIPTQAPEPATFVIWGLGLAGLGVAARWRRKSQGC